MSSYYQNGNDADDRDRKLSGFSKRGTPDQPEEGGRDGNRGQGKGKKNRGRAALSKQNKRLWVALLLDVLLLVLAAGVVVGSVFGYRAVRELYAPSWEVRDVVFGVKLENIYPEMIDYDKSGKLIFLNKPIWSSESEDADMLGTVTESRNVLISTDEGNTVTLYLKVEAKAYYREGKGYRMGETLLLAGSVGTYRLEGLTAEGMIIFMHEASDPLAQTSWSDQFEQAQDNTKG